MTLIWAASSWIVGKSARKGPVPRKINLVLAIAMLALAAILTFVLLRGQPRFTPNAIEATDENASEPLHQEMNCIDRLLQESNLSANEVGPALAGCEAGGSGNQSLAR